MKNQENKSRKVLFILKNLPPVRCGVGDYTMFLAKELERRGVETHFLVSRSMRQFSTNLERGRIHYVDNWINFKLRNDTFVTNNLWDLISIQFVNYSFSKYGVPFLLRRNIDNFLRYKKLNIMFHECWLGMYKSSSYRDKVHGWVQRQLVKRMCSGNKELILSTQLPYYRQELARVLRKEVLLFPLFSNIRFKENIHNYNQGKLRIGLFGSIQRNAVFDEFIVALLKVKQELHIPTENFEFVFIGHNGQELEKYKEVLAQHNFKFFVLGILPNQEVSVELQKLAIGLVTTPTLVELKSGSAIAYWENSVKTINIGNEGDHYKLSALMQSPLDERLRYCLSSNEYRPCQWPVSVDNVAEMYLDLVEEDTNE